MSRKLQGLWIGLLIIAAASRLTALAWMPLAPDEATRALAALDAARGEGWPASAESPLLLVGNAVLFGVFGAGDGIARLLPAMAGVALAALPLLWRRRLGDVGALAAAGILTVSPLTLLAARRVEPTLLGALGAGGLISLALLHDDDALAAWRPVLVAGGVTLAVVGGPSAYDVLLAGALALAFASFGAGENRLAVAREWARPTLWGLAGALMISVGLGARWSGWSGPLDGLAAWLASWRGTDLGPASLSLLLLYEPLALLLALVGLGYALRDTVPLPKMLIFWSGILVLVLVIRPAAAPTGMASALLPLALLVGYGAQQLAAWVPGRSLKWLALHITVSAVLWVPVGLALASHSMAHTTPEVLNGNPAVQMALVLVGMAILVGLHVMLGILFSMVLLPPVIWRGALLGVAVMLLFLQGRFGVGMAFLNRATAVEPGLDVVTSPDTRLLLRTVTDHAHVRGLRADRTDIALVGLSPEALVATRWTLRDYAPMEAVVWPDTADFVITPAGGDVQPPNAQWVGARFVSVVRGPWSRFACVSWVPPNCARALRWYFYREATTESARQEVLLWRRR